MDNDAKSLLMQYLYRFTEHYEIQEPALTSFKKREELLEKLKMKNEEAWQVITALFDSFIKSDRIKNDKEKFDKARILWEAENADAEKEKVHMEMLLIKFCKDHSIPVGQMSLEE